jgi:hypothetical protein
LIRRETAIDTYRIERIEERLGTALSLATTLLMLAISLLSKFPAYSLFSAIFGWPYLFRLGRLKHSGGAQ